MTLSYREIQAMRHGCHTGRSETMTDNANDIITTTEELDDIEVDFECEADGVVNNIPRLIATIRYLWQAGGFNRQRRIEEAMSGLEEASADDHSDREEPRRIEEQRYGL